jgi:hypothetical protein
MMLRLILDISHDRGNPRWADADGRVPVLPRESVSDLIHPSRSIRLERAHDVGGTGRWRNFQQKVDMICSSTDCDHVHVAVSGDGAHVSPQARGIGDESGALFGTEDTVNQLQREGVRHLVRFFENDGRNDVRGITGRCAAAADAAPPSLRRRHPAFARRAQCASAAARLGSEENGILAEGQIPLPMRRF